MKDKLGVEDNKKIVVLNGEKYRLSIDRYKAIYPREEMKTRCYAECFHKDSEHFKEVREKLGDDWVIDLDESPELYCEALKQVNENRFETIKPI